LLLFITLQRPENNEQAIRRNADEDAHEAFETGRKRRHSLSPTTGRQPRPWRQAEVQHDGDALYAEAAGLQVRPATPAESGTMPSRPREGRRYPLWGTRWSHAEASPTDLGNAPVSYQR